MSCLLNCPSTELALETLLPVSCYTLQHPISSHIQGQFHIAALLPGLGPFKGAISLLVGYHPEKSHSSPLNVAVTDGRQFNFKETVKQVCRPCVLHHSHSLCSAPCTSSAPQRVNHALRCVATSPLNMSATETVARTQKGIMTKYSESEWKY